MAYSEAQKRAIIKHRAKLKRIPFDVRKEDYERIKQAADEAGEPVNRFIKVAIEMRIQGGE